jgi:hypothetical protein
VQAEERRNERFSSVSSSRGTRTGLDVFISSTQLLSKFPLALKKIFCRVASASQLLSSALNSRIGPGSK